MKKQYQESNALVSSQGSWTVLRPVCHPDTNFKVLHSTAVGIYEVQCVACCRTFLRVDVGSKR